jgi:hypothetical protein
MRKAKKVKNNVSELRYIKGDSPTKTQQTCNKQKISVRENVVDTTSKCIQYF